MEGGGWRRDIGNKVRAALKSGDDKANFLEMERIRKDKKRLYKANIRAWPPVLKFRDMWEHAVKMNAEENVEYTMQTLIADAAYYQADYIQSAAAKAADKFGAMFDSGRSATDSLIRVERPDGNTFFLLPPASAAIENNGEDDDEEPDLEWMRTWEPESNTISNALYDDGSTTTHLNGTYEDNDDDLSFGLGGLGVPVANLGGGGARNAVTSVVLGGVVVLMSVLGSMA